MREWDQPHLSSGSIWTQRVVNIEQMMEFPPQQDSVTRGIWSQSPAQQVTTAAGRAGRMPPTLTHDALRLSWARRGSSPVEKDPIWAPSTAVASLTRARVRKTPPHFRTVQNFTCHSTPFSSDAGLLCSLQAEDLPKRFVLAFHLNRSSARPSLCQCDLCAVSWPIYQTRWSLSDT